MLKIDFYDQYGNTVNELTQWDNNVILTLPNFKYSHAPVFHFSDGTGANSITVSSVLTDGVVTVVVPNIFLTRTRPIDVFVFLYDPNTDEGKTIYKKTISINKKLKPNDYEYIDNTEIIEITTLGIRLQALIDEAEESVHVHIDELKSNYDNAILGIKQAIADDVHNLNQSITQSRDTLERDILSSKNNLELNVNQTLQTILNNIDDGSPKGVFSNVSELTNKSAGIYLYLNDNSDDNGFVYYWNGTELSEKLIHYQGTIINDGVIVYSNLSDELKKQIVGIIVNYTLRSEDWDDKSIVLDVSSVYTVTEKTKADVDFNSTTYAQLINDECIGLYITTEKLNDEDRLIVHALGEKPTADIVIQITIKEVVI